VINEDLSTSGLGNTTGKLLTANRNVYFVSNDNNRGVLYKYLPEKDHWLPVVYYEVNIGTLTSNSVITGEYLVVPFRSSLPNGIEIRIRT